MANGSRSASVIGFKGGNNMDVQVNGDNKHLTIENGVALSESGNFRRPINQMQQEAMEK